MTEEKKVTDVKKRGRVSAEEIAKMADEAIPVSPLREPPLMEEDPAYMKELNDYADALDGELTDESQDILDAAKMGDWTSLDGEPITMSFSSKGILKTHDGLHRKLAKVMLAVGRIPKNGTAPAAMGGYKFVQVGDAADAIRKELGALGISMLPETIEEVSLLTGGGSRGVTTTQTVRTTWRLTDGETGETATIQSMGTGQDNGDKYSPKAQTNAMKYALLMGFLLSTGDDPEASDLSEPIAGPGITIAASNVTGVRQGGRQGQATTPQLDEIRRLARALDLSPEALATAIGAALGGKAPEIESLESANDQQRAVLDFLGTLTFDECGSVIRSLTDTK